MITKQIKCLYPQESVPQERAEGRQQEEGQGGRQRGGGRVRDGGERGGLHHRPVRHPELQEEQVQVREFHATFLTIVKGNINYSVV